MRGRWVLFLMVLVFGCHSYPHAPRGSPAETGSPYSPGATPTHPEGAYLPEGEAPADVPSQEPGSCQPERGCPVPGRCPMPCPPLTCRPKPQVEVRQEEIHVTAPRQRVVIPRPPGAQAQAVEHQQVVQTRQVLLVPQQVLVPFVQTTTTGPIRVAGAAETQVLNLTSVTNAATQGLAVTNTAAGGVLLNAAASPPAGGSAGTGQAPAGANAAAPGAGQPAASATPQTLTDCMAQLRDYEQRIKQLTNTVEALSGQVDRLKASAVAGPAPAPTPAPAPAAGPCLVPMPGVLPAPAPAK